MKTRLLFVALALTLAAGCAGGRPSLPPRSPLPDGCYSDCPIRSPDAQEDSLWSANPATEEPR